MSAAAALCACATHAPPNHPRLDPQRLEQMRSAAQQASPPVESAGQLQTSDLVDVAQLDPTFKLDVRYATSNNFLGTPVYTQARVFLQRPAAAALVRASQRLREQGFGLLLFDGYRPWWVTKLFWEATPESQRAFVADPAQGSRHNRGCAIDLSLYDLKSGREVQMPSPYDEFSKRAHPDYIGGTAAERARRDTLRHAMEAEGFTVNEDEWWHYDYLDWQSYPIGTEPFEKIDAGR
jgi:D-alanyl-D-alanine dipeptidase